ncbi:hypothetical protein EDF31_102377 [Curtobacterium sp. PhB142]|uniref:sce7725 family protein n=1 Tax=unclassified Curtobacterium TaxID=257496 RepID=UPI00104B3A80|nr:MULTISPECIES: sce7725 family protein [unclassified Curtobacterium]TCL87672.1 hypothetical protein EDF31_102377 [Curtobacterium sp. PhB142]TCM04979.1 hypothetical protein EDF26_101202 [Curtobacterium sp. PhB134]
MVYYPYFRGKQFELIALRESAEIIARNSFVPIIEPVRESLASLGRTLEALAQHSAKAIIVTNPRYGDLRGNAQSILDMLDETYPQDENITAGVLLTSDTTVASAIQELNADSRRNPSLIHAGFSMPGELTAGFQELTVPANVFIESEANTLYRRHFTGSTRVLIRDGFRRVKNSAYPEIENFSDLHATYPDLGMDGYGDFLTVGDFYAEGGGPAYAVAIHLTFIDPVLDDTMRIYHFISDSNDTPTDPAGKFAQALQKLIDRLDSGNSGLLRTSAIEEFRELHDRQHFPGLGHVKKLSMKHHLETLADYHQSAHV